MKFSLTGHTLGKIHSLEVVAKNAPPKPVEREDKEAHVRQVNSDENGDSTA